MTTAMALGIDRELATQRVKALTTEVHTLAVRIVQLDDAIDLDDADGRVGSMKSKQALRDVLTHERSVMLRDLVLERQVLLAWRH